jgi:NADH:ubiquinone oxidoreductase subunit F (NADH-binding)/NADH:ubiquinone oxidoreductase subunit E
MHDQPRAEKAAAKSRVGRARGQARGRHVVPTALEDVRALIGDGPYRRDLLIEYLHRIQDHFHAIDSQHMAALAQLTKLPQTEVFEVASFYHHFDTVREGDERPPPLTVRVCDSITCEMAGAHALARSLEDHVGDSIRIQKVPCVGRCHAAPIAVVGSEALEQADTSRVLDAIENDRSGARAVEGFIDLDRYREQGGYQLFESCRNGSRQVEEVIAALEDSNLRGLGGAGFPAGRKWRILREQPAPRMLAVNIDEGEPGTFKDRFYLERDPHRFLEGTLIAAWAIEAQAVYLYLRDEYAAVRLMLAQELDRLRACFPDSLPPLHLRRGAGAYICGEESAMIESIEGKRGMPRLRPPYVAEVGLFDRPTLEHNMETLYWVRDIVERGADWFASQGTNGRKGLRSFSVSGRVKQPGVHLAPAGITIRQLIDDYCGGMLDGHEFYGYFPGGASGGILPASLGDVPLDFDTLQEYGCFIGSAAVVVFSDHDRARDLALNAMRFFAHESCGQCTPCRVGTVKAVGLMEQERWDIPLLEELSSVMVDASICGLGQAAPNPLLCAIKYFPQEFES